MQATYASPHLRLSLVASCEHASDAASIVCIAIIIMIGKAVDIADYCEQLCRGRLALVIAISSTITGQRV